LQTLREFRWYFLSIPVAALLYGAIFVFAPSIRILTMGAERARLWAQSEPMPIIVVPNLPTSLRLSPDALALKPGQEFSVDVWLTSAYPTRGTQLSFEYDPKLIDVTGVDEGEYYRSWALKNGATTMMVPSPMIDPNLGRVNIFTVVILGGESDAGPNGSAVMATVKGRAKTGVAGTTTLRLMNVEISAVVTRKQGQSPGTIKSLDDAAIADTAITVGVNPTLPTPPVARTATPNVPPTPVQ
jgi:hypothetical protein